MSLRINLEKVEQVTVTRSFTKKVQLEQYEPVEFFASVQATMKPEATEAEINRTAIELNDAAVSSVETSLESYIRKSKPPF